MTTIQEELHHKLLAAAEYTVHISTFGVEPKKNYCRACSNKKYGVKSRKNYPHTCGLKENN